MNPESLIFDIDGTLWDARALIAEGYNIQLRSEGKGHLHITADDFLPVFGKETWQIADGVFPAVPKPERYELIGRCIQMENRYLAENPCRVWYPRVPETMEKLAQKYRLFIVSNGELGYPELCVEKLGLGQWTTGTLCYGQTRTSKGQTILRLMAEHNIRNAVYIGDTQGDYESTLEAGIPFIFAAYGFGTAERYDAKINSFEELTAIL